MIETTCKCAECYYHKFIDGVRICSLQKTFLSNNTIGYYGGYKSRNIQSEKRVKRFQKSVKKGGIK